jgi:penicillin-binding protein 1C
VAIKTATGGGHRDAWSVAYSDRLLVGVWVGNHDQRRMNHLTGARGAAEAVHEILAAVMPERQPQRAVLPAFAPPEGYVACSVCPLSGKLAGRECPHARVEYFAPGTEPTEVCPYHAVVRVDRRNGLRAGPSCPAAFVESRHLLDLPAQYDAWARHAHLDLAPRRRSPLCPGDAPRGDPQVAITEPRDHARFLYDPDTPQAYSTLRLAAEVTPVDERLIWLIDGVPIARVGYPFEVRWPVEPGAHTITAELEGRPTRSRPVTVVVEN